MRKILLFGLATFAIAALPQTSHAQIGVTPQIGFYVPGDDFESIRAGADSIKVNSEGSLALGFNIDFGMLRGSLAFASAATLSSSGATGGEVGEGKLLAVAADLVLRPIPRILVLQPYLLVGGGLRRADYDYETDALDNAFPQNESDFAIHAGVGADVILGGLGVTAEITDFISKDSDDKWGRHDAFGFVGLELST